MSNNVWMASSRIIINIRFSVCAIVVGYAYSIYFVYLRSVVYSDSIESDDDSDCDSESTDSEWIGISDLIREQVGVDNDDDIDSGSEPVS